MPAFPAPADRAWLTRSSAGPLQVDADHSGKLDADEVATLCKKMGKKLNDKGLQAAMGEMDEDGSGEVRQ